MKNDYPQNEYYIYIRRRGGGRGGVADDLIVDWSIDYFNQVKRAFVQSLILPQLAHFPL